MRHGDTGYFQNGQIDAPTHLRLTGVNASEAADTFTLVYENVKCMLTQKFKIFPSQNDLELGHTLLLNTTRRSHMGVQLSHITSHLYRVHITFYFEWTWRDKCTPMHALTPHILQSGRVTASATIEHQYEVIYSEPRRIIRYDLELHWTMKFNQRSYRIVGSMSFIFQSPDTL